MNDLDNLREEIDEADEAVCAALKKRFAVVKKIGEYKKENGIRVLDKTRESAVFEHIARLFDEKDEKNAAKEIYDAIVRASKNLQK